MFEKNIYIERRKKLISKINSGILLFLGTSDASINYPGNQYRYRQDSTFNYFFGLTDPDFAAIIDVESGEEIIFGNDVDIDDIIWMGPQPLVKEKALSIGISKTLPYSQLSKYIQKTQSQNRNIHYLPPYRYKNMITLHQMLNIPFDQLKSQASEIGRAHV